MKENDFEVVLTESLKRNSEYELPNDFADRVVSMIKKESLEKETTMDKWWLIIGIVAITCAMIYALISMNALILFKGYWGVISFGIAFVAALHIIDKKARIGLR